MKKAITFLKLLPFILWSLCLQKQYAQKSQRMVLLEQFTNASCVPCSQANPGIISLYNANSSKMAMIYYHVDWPGSDDPMFLANPTEISNRIAYYTVSAVPQSVLDGVPLSAIVTQTNINNNYAVTAPFTIQLVHEVVNGVTTVQMTMTKTAATTGTYTAQIAAIEDLMSYSNPPGANGETQFYHVFKKFLPNQYGTALNNMNIGDSQVITKSWVYSNVMNPANLKAVAFIQDISTKAMQQAAYSTSATNIPPGADFTVNTTTACTGEVDFTDLSSYATSWKWDFGDSTTSSQQNPTHTYTANGTYTVKLTVVNNGNSASATKNNYIIVSMPNAPTGTDGYGISGSTVQLQAAGSGTLNWYTASIGGTLVDTGNTYITPPLTTTTDYFVDDNVVDPLVNVGKVNKEATAGGYFSANDVRGLYFTVYKPCTIESVKIYVDTAGMRTIQVLQDEGGPVVMTKTITGIPSGTQRVTLDFAMQPGIDYFIKCTKVSGSIVDLWRDNANATYPQALNGVLSITASNAGTPGYWYFFYDWEVQGGPCISPRTKVTAHITTGIEVQDALFSYKLSPNPNEGKFSLNIHSIVKDDITVSMFDLSGKMIYAELIPVVGDMNKQFDFTVYAKGIYFLKIATKQRMLNEKLVIE